MARSIFIGDVHSCAAELAELLSAVAVSADDQVFFVGDLLTRGPDPRGVLQLFRTLRARSAIGNHEQRLLAARHAQLRGEAGPKLSASHAQVVALLDDADWAILESLPLWIDVPEHDVRVVHAGIVPGVPFDKQDPWLMTHIRSIDERGKPSEKWGALWGSLYHGEPHIVFGHNARQRPQLHPARHWARHGMRVRRCADRVGATGRRGSAARGDSSRCDGVGACPSRLCGLWPRVARSLSDEWRS